MTPVQILLSLYFFLAGIAVSTGRLLWVLPLATAASAALHSLAGAVSMAAVPAYRSLEPQEAALWRVDVMHLAYSAITGERWLLIHLTAWQEVVDVRVQG
jgi:hypothetical protein